MKLKNIFPILFGLFLSACAPVTVNLPTGNPPITLETSTPASSLPDLVISNVYLGMQGFVGGSSNCVTAYAPFEIRVTIQNLGDVPAYNISVVELSTVTSLAVGDLGARNAMKLYFPATSPNGTYTFGIDSQNTIPESNESNNVFSYLAITPTPPVLCTPPVTPVPNLQTPVPAGETGAATLSQSILFNSVYRSPDWGEFQLMDGVYYRTPPTSQESPEIYTTRIHGPVFYGDINADGLEDALVILNTQNGGTGHFIELAAVLDQSGNAYNVATTPLGDRVLIESGSVENGVIVLKMRNHGPNDGLCCPSQAVVWSFVLEEGQLTKLP